MRTHRPDYLIITALVFLVLFGLVVLNSASSHLGQEKFGDSFYYLKHQIYYGLSFGLIGFFLAYKFYYRRYQKLAIPLLLISIVLLALVFTPLGIRAGGAERWVKLGPVTFQPAELAKLTVVLYLAAWLSGQGSRSRDFLRGAVPMMLLLGLVCSLLLYQPATSTVVIIFAAAMIIYFLSGAKIRYIALLTLIMAAVVGALVMITPYRLERITNFLKPNADPLAGGYHQIQAQIAIGSGEIAGVGYGQSTAKISHLPEPIGDSIFAVLAAEFGFIGSGFLIVLFGLLVVKIFLLANKTPDKFGKLLLVGYGSVIGLQVFVNIGAISGILPLTGVPLPFISYGGSALAIFMTIGGMIANISRHS